MRIILDNDDMLENPGSGWTANFYQDNIYDDPDAVAFGGTPADALNALIKGARLDLGESSLKSVPNAGHRLPTVMYPRELLGFMR